MAFLYVVAVFLLTGCGTLLSDRPQGKSGVMKEVMERKNRMVLLSGESLVPDKPVLVLLHGATDDPSEMLSIAGQWAETHNIFLYSYNFHQSIERLASDLVQEMKALKATTEALTRPDSAARQVTVITYSYAAIVFRKSVLVSGDETLFSGVSLIQLVPTAGGSLQARSIPNPIAAWLVGLASKPSAAGNPRGPIAEELWDEEGTRKFNRVIRLERVHTLLVEADPHSLAAVPDKQIRRRYRNGIGSNVVMIPKHSGVTHETFPNHPVALSYLKQTIESTQREQAMRALAGAEPEFGKNDGF